MEMDASKQCGEPHPVYGWRTPCRETKGHSMEKPPVGGHRNIMSDFKVLDGQDVDICKPCSCDKHDACPYFWQPPDEGRLCCCEPPTPTPGWRRIVPKRKA